MRWKGINYSVGVEYAGRTVSTRPEFDHRIVRREIEIIKNDLHCNAVRISGMYADRLKYATECALEVGLEPWTSPQLIDASPEDTLALLAACAEAAENLRARYGNSSPQPVIVCGCEMTLFMQGLIDGESFMERIRTLSDVAYWRSGGPSKTNAGLNRYLAQAAEVVRERFDGRITYASGAWEQVDWTPFDIVGIDHYRDARNKSTYVDKLREYKRHEKPIAVTEFGCCTYAGAEDRGGMGWAIVDWTKVPPRLDGDYVRDESVQARYIVELLDIFDAESIDGAFVFTFTMPALPGGPSMSIETRDIPSYALVMALDEENGAAYPDMSWEPKQAFRVLADRYGRHG